MAYLLDANVFITAKNGYYSFDMVPAFWEWLDRSNQSGVVCSIQAVRDELLATGDELAVWAQERRGGFFVAPDDDTAAAFPELCSWVNGESRYKGAAKNTFCASADFFLVAHALGHGDTVVTHERPAPQSQTTVKIPDACDALGVLVMDPFEMLRTEHARFVLDA